MNNTLRTWKLSTKDRFHAAFPQAQALLYFFRIVLRTALKSLFLGACTA